MIRHGYLAAVLATIFVAGGATASPVSAGGQLEGGKYPFTVDATDIAEQQNAFTVFGMAVECTDSSYGAEKVEGGEIEEATSELTVVPGYNNPKCKAESLKATVKTNGCDYVIHIGAPVKEGEYDATLDIKCPEGKMIEILTYLSPTNENILGCRITIGGQTGLAGATVANGAEGKVELGGSLTGISAEEEGLCGEGTTSEAGYDANVEMAGTDSKGEAIGLNLEPRPPVVLTSAGPVILIGTLAEEAGANAWTAFGEEAHECTETVFTGHRAEETPHEAVTSGSNRITVVPHYAECVTSSFPGTVSLNECDFELELRGTTEEDRYAVTTAVECPEGKNVQLKVYTGASHSITACTWTFTYEPTYEGLEAVDTTSGLVDVVGTIEGIVLHRSGFGCSSETDEAVVLHVDFTMEGVDAESEKPQEISLSHE